MISPKITRYCFPALLGVLLALAASLLWSNAVTAKETVQQLNIGYSSRSFVNVPKEDIRVAVCLLSEKVARRAASAAESRIYDSLSAMERDLKDKKLDVVAVPPDEFLDLRRHVAVEPVMMTATNKSYEVEVLLLVRNDSTFRSLRDLKNRTIVVPAKTAQYGSVYQIWLDTILARQGLPAINVFFSSVREARTASQALMPVFFRTADACVATGQVFNLAVELNPQIGNDLRVIAETGKLAGGVIALRKDLSKQRKDKIKEALLTLHEDPEGRQLFILFQLESLIPYRPEYMKETEAFLDEYRRLRKTNGKDGR